MKNKHLSAILNTWTLDAGIPLPFLPSPGRGGHVHTFQEDLPAAAGWVADQNIEGGGEGGGKKLVAGVKCQKMAVRAFRAEPRR